MPRGSWWMKQNTHLLAQVEISAGRGVSNSNPRARPRRRTSRAAVRVPARSSSSRSSSSPALKWKSITSRSGVPLTARSRSPPQTPAAAAALPWRTRLTTTPAGASAQEWIFMLTLDGRGGVQEPHAARDVLQTREDREGRGGPDGHPEHRSEEHTSELQSQSNLVCRLLLEKKKNTK